MDNGYKMWKINKREVNQKRFKFFMKILPFLFILLVIVFFFGYDYTLFSSDKLMEFIPGSLGIIIIFVIISVIKYPMRKYIPLCNKCHTEIKNVK